MNLFDKLYSFQDERPNDKFGRILFKASYFFAFIGGIILMLVVLINVISIVSRIMFSNPLVGDFELVKIGSAIAIASFFPICHLKKGNVIVDFVTAGLSLKTRYKLDLLSSVIYFIISLFFSWRMIYGGKDMFNYQEETMLLQFPIWIPFLPVTLSFALLSLCCVYTTKKYLNECFGKF